MVNHTPAKVDSYDAYSSDQSNGFEWECSCGNEDNGFDSFVEAYDDLKQHCDTANEQLITDVAMKLYNLSKDGGDKGNNFNRLAKHVLENGYKA